MTPKQKAIETIALLDSVYHKQTQLQKEIYDFVKSDFKLVDIEFFDYEPDVMAVKFLSKNKKFLNNTDKYKIWIYYDTKSETILDRYLKDWDIFVNSEMYVEYDINKMKIGLSEYYKKNKS